LLLRNGKNVTPEVDEGPLREPLNTNRSLTITYAHTDALNELLSDRREVHARRFWAGWYRRAQRSRVEPLRVFARQLCGYRARLLTRCRGLLRTSTLGASNMQNKVIQQLGHGLRDNQHFFDKIRAAFPGNG
jgi:transposase